MLVYFFIAGFITVSLLVSEFTDDYRLENYLFVLSGIIMFIIAGFRTMYVGSDTPTYILIFKSFEYGGIFKPKLAEFFTGRIEYGYLLLNKFLYFINGNYVFLFSFFSFVTIFITFFVIKKMSPNIMLSVIIYFGYRLYTFSMSSIRASVSITICMLAFYFFMKKKKWLTFFLIIVATSFHLSAMTFLAIFIIDKINPSRKAAIISIVATLISFVALNKIINIAFIGFNRYSTYLNGGEIIGANLATVINFALVFVVYIFGEIYLEDKESELNCLLRKVMFFTVLVSFVAIRVPMFGRFIILFGSLMIIYIPLVTEQIGLFNNRFVSKFVITSGFLLHFFIVLILKPEWNILVPYSNVIIELFR